MTTEVDSGLNADSQSAQENGRGEFAALNAAYTTFTCRERNAMLGSILGRGLLHRKPNVSLRNCVGLTALGKVLRTLTKPTL